MGSRRARPVCSVQHVQRAACGVQHARCNMSPTERIGMFETDVPTCGASGHHRSSQRHFVCCMLYAARFMRLHVGRMPFVLRSASGNRSSKGARAQRTRVRTQATLQPPDHATTRESDHRHSDASDSNSYKRKYITMHEQTCADRHHRSSSGSERDTAASANAG